MRQAAWVAAVRETRIAAYDCKVFWSAFIVLLTLLCSCFLPPLSSPLLTHIMLAFYHSIDNNQIKSPW